MLEVTLINTHILYQKAGHSNVTKRDTGAATNWWKFGLPSGQYGVGSRTQMLQDIRFNHMLFHHPVKLAGNAKSTYNGLTLTVSVASVMPVLACIQHHVLGDITLYVNTIFTIHQEMALKS